jgi:hypothetical protein
MLHLEQSVIELDCEWWASEWIEGDVLYIVLWSTGVCLVFHRVWGFPMHVEYSKPK